MWDAWDLDSLAEQQPLPLEEPAELDVLSAGPLVAELRVQRKLSHSQMTQVIRLRRGSRRLDFVTAIDWRDKHRLLKVAFPLNIHANEAIHEIQFGHLRRPNHRSRPYDADRFEVSNHKWSALAEETRGAAVLNDCKYGLSVQGNSINLTLLKSALAPDPQADQGKHTFTYALYAWNGNLADSGVVQQAYELNVPVQVVPGAGGDGSLFSLDAPNIILETVKPAEDGSGDVVLRLYESMRSATRAVLTSHLPVSLAWQTDMLENFQAELPLKDGKLVLEFRPFEIKTIRLKM
jgi:alpha-mannosidase